MKKIILKIGSLILLLITTILISIGTFSCSTKENNNAYLFNNIKVKRAFENAPEKETSLPGFNKDFKIYFNFTTALEIKDFMIYLNDYESSIPEDGQIYLFSGIMQNPMEPNSFIDMYMSIGRFSFNDLSGLEFFFNMNLGDSVEPILNLKYLELSNGFVLNINETDISSLENNTIVSESMNLLNNEFFSVANIQSYNTYNGNNVETFLANQDFIYGYDVVSNSAVPNLLNIIKDSSTGILNMIIELFVIAIPIFWVNNKLTFIGTLAFFTVAVPIVYWVINFVLNLIKKIKLSRK